ncbi:MAG TPA: helix-hairpin-helix domain-containing protein [Bacteroidales bacterium]
MDFNKLKFYLREYLTFTKGEKVGIIVLLILIISVLILSSLMPHLIPASPGIDVNEFKKEIAQFEKETDSMRKPSGKVFHYKDTVKHPYKPQPINKRSIPVLELNNADSAGLDELPGIGPVYSRRILKYRALLGGYFSLNQLSEVYGLKPETCEKIRNYLVVDTLKIRKINLNTAEFREINAHPYISFEQTKSIMKYRKHNKIVSLKQLEEAQIFTTTEMVKLRPYLLFE